MPNQEQPRRPRIVLGVSGSIAAYKAADLASGLVKAGYDVHAVLTRGGARFIGPATFSALTGNACPIDTFDEVIPGEIAHIWLAQNVDAVVIAPASANVISRIVAGAADDMLTAIALATTSSILIAPAMNTGMWNNAATQANLETLRTRGFYFVEPVTGRLACRMEGLGKLADVADILATVRELVEGKADLAGKRILITAGPTREAIDPVRYLTNRSSGKMGYALAERAVRHGATVTLVSGPTGIAPPAGLELIRVETAEQMAEAVLTRQDRADVIIAAAAVADYRPESPNDTKLKKNGRITQITLTQNTDIIAEAGRRKRPDQILIGFAAETDKVVENARLKLASKNLDWIVVNDITAPGAGFDTDTNIVTIVGRDGSRQDLPQLSKHDVADKILDLLKP